MTQAFEFIFTLFDKSLDFLSSCTFSVYGYNVNMLGIFLAVIVFGVALSAFYHGGSY